VNSVFLWVCSVVVSVQEEEGWLRGRLRGKSGVFPSNFVRLSPAETDRPKCKIDIYNEISALCQCIVLLSKIVQ